MKQIVEEYYTQDGWSPGSSIKNHLEKNPTHVIKYFQMTQHDYVGNYNELKPGAYAVVIYEEATNDLTT